jgi:AraC-like DNA-binding protein
MAKPLSAEHLPAPQQETPTGVANRDGHAIGEATAQTVTQVVLTVQDALDDAWTLSMMAARAGYEEHHFAHAFRAVVGEPPMRYLRTLRLERAAHDIVFAPDKELVAIQVEAGYGSSEAFRRAFVRAFGKPPTAFRGSQTAAKGPAPRARPNALPRPAWLKAPPELVRFGPLRAVSLMAASFDGEQIGAAWRDFMVGAASGEPAPGRWDLGAATSPWGWLTDRRNKEYRCLRLDPPPRLRIKPPLTPWTMRAGWFARFDYEGSQAALFDLFSWVFGAWLPAAALRYRFAPVVTLYDREVWTRTRFTEAAARVFVPVRSIHESPYAS